jgi:hypothetical protein
MNDHQIRLNFFRAYSRPVSAAVGVDLRAARTAMAAFARKSFEWCTHQYVNDSRCFYDLGRTDSYVIQLKERQKDKNGLQQALDSAIRNTERSIVCNEESADAHAVLVQCDEIPSSYGRGAPNRYTRTLQREES